MPHFQIKLLEGKTEAQKNELAQALVKTACEVLGNNEDSYSVSIEDYNEEVWKTQVYPNEIIRNKDILYKEPGYEM
jgi:4-oxalocrotonate tautomerase